jgi:hypothetical protein
LLAPHNIQRLCPVSLPPFASCTTPPASPVPELLHPFASCATQTAASREQHL